MLCGVIVVKWLSLPYLYKTRDGEDVRILAGCPASSSGRHELCSNACLVRFSETQQYMKRDSFHFDLFSVGIRPWFQRRLRRYHFLIAVNENMTLCLYLSGGIRDT